MLRVIRLNLKCSNQMKKLSSDVRAVLLTFLSKGGKTVLRTMKRRLDTEEKAFGYQGRLHMILNLTLTSWTYLVGLKHLNSLDRKESTQYFTFFLLT